MNPEKTKVLGSAGQSIIRSLGPQFTGQIELHAHKGTLGTIKIQETIKPGNALKGVSNDEKER